MRTTTGHGPTAQPALTKPQRELMRAAATDPCLLERITQPARRLEDLGYATLAPQASGRMRIFPTAEGRERNAAENEREQGSREGQRPIRIRHENRGARPERPGATAKPGRTTAATTGQGRDETDQEQRKMEGSIEVIRIVPNDEAEAILGAAYMGGKNAGNGTAVPTRMTNGEPYVLCDFPLGLVRGNEAGDRYDATVDPERAKRYATLKIDTPVSLRFGPWSARNGATTAWMADGGHRTSAARMRGRTHMTAMMPLSHHRRIEALASIAIKPNPSDEPDE